jgi:hypothetical protein
VDGPAILARTMSVVRDFGKIGFRGQYHSRSDHHSKVLCWAIMFDLLQESQLLRERAADGRVVFGLNHEMRDYKDQRTKALDLVVARPASKERGAPLTDLVDEYGIQLSDAEQGRLDALPELLSGPVGPVQLALEAKACMTAFSKARPRLYDELNSSHLTIHGDTDQAIAAGVAMVNRASKFISPSFNKRGLAGGELEYSVHKQPGDAASVVQKLHELPRRAGVGERGYDAFGIVLVDCKNDGSPVTLVTDPPAPAKGNDYHYDQLIRRTTNHYSFRFGQA